MIKEVVKLGSPILKQRSLEVDLKDISKAKLASLVEDMTDTMIATNGVGISAVQIGVLKRIAIIGYSGNNPRYPDMGTCPITVLINPEIEIIDDNKISYNEGCLSIPEQRVDVTRPKKLKYTYLTIDGDIVTGVSEDFFARVLQHEIDHMNGVLITDHV